MSQHPSRLADLYRAVHALSQGDPSGCSGLRQPCPRKEDPERAVDTLGERGYDACEIDFEGGFWMDWDDTAQLGVLAHEAGIVLSVHTPIPAFLGHTERGKKLNMAIGMLDARLGWPSPAARRWSSFIQVSPMRSAALFAEVELARYERRTTALPGKSALRHGTAVPTR